MKFIFNLLLLFAFSFTLAEAADEITVGTISCREWIEDRSTDTNYINKSVDQSWILGFLSSYSVTTRINFMAEVPAKSIFIWMDKYCANHTNKKIDEGALILAHQLTEKVQHSPTRK